MAFPICDHLYRVAVNSEHSFVFVSAKNREDLVKFLVSEYPDPSVIYGAKEVGSDGSLTTVPLVTDPLYLQLRTAQSRASENYHVTYIDGDPWCVRLPTGGTGRGRKFVYNEWHHFHKNLGVLPETEFHFQNMASLCQDTSSLGADYRTIRGGSLAPTFSSFITTTATSYFTGFRPMLVPLNPDTFKPDPSRLSHLKNGEHVNIGTLYMDNTPLDIPSGEDYKSNTPDYIPGARLRIGDTHSDLEKQIQFIKCDYFLLADRNLIKNISWDDLDKQGLVFGKEAPRIRGKKQEPLDQTIRQAQEKQAQGPQAVEAMERFKQEFQDLSK